MTWYKQLNVVDLGMLGSPIMAKLRNGPMMTEYYLNYGLPDLIEAHGPWVYQYCNSIFSTKKFNNLYSQVGSQYDMIQVCSENKNKQSLMIYWIRKDIKKDSNSSERKFLDELQNKLTVSRIKEEISNCNIAAENCSYIARTVYKFIDELRASNEFEMVYSLFMSETDKALLRGWRDGKAHEVIIDSVQNKLFHTLERESDVKAEFNVPFTGPHPEIEENSQRDFMTIYGESEMEYIGSNWGLTFHLLKWIMEASHPSCPDCSNGRLEEVVFPENGRCECNCTDTLIIGRNVTLKNGSIVTINAPKVNIEYPFYVEENAVVKIVHP